MTFSDRLKKIIEKLGVSQSEFARNVGLTRAQVSQYISGTIIPKVDKLETFVSKYDTLNLHWLLTGHGEMFLEKDVEPSASSLEDQMKNVDSRLSRLESDIKEVLAELRGNKSNG